MQKGCIRHLHLCFILHPTPPADMRFYSFDSVFSFGRHQGQTVAEVLAENPGYLNFCLQVLDHFALRRHELESWQ